MSSQRDSSRPADASSRQDQRRQIAELTEMVGGLAHELRNPLSTMMVNVKLATEDLEDADIHPDDARRRAVLKLEVVKREAERLQTLFDKFLNLTVSDGPDLVATDINAVVRGLAEFFEPSARDTNITIDLVLASDPLVCDADEKLLRQALLNIVINGQQAMPDGGTLRIITDVDDKDVIIRVADSGAGVACEDRDRILRPFFSTKVGGNGLGLSITQRIISEHGGTLSFESESGEGTTFTIRLPRVAPASSR